MGECGSEGGEGGKERREEGRGGGRGEGEEGGGKGRREEGGGRGGEEGEETKETRGVLPVSAYSLFEFPILIPINVVTEMAAMATNMMLLYRTAWFLLQENSSSDRGDTILQGLGMRARPHSGTTPATHVSYTVNTKKTTKHRKRVITTARRS